MVSPSVSSTSNSSPEVTYSLNIFVSPGGKVLNMFSRRFGVIFMPSCLCSNLPGIGVAVVLGGDLVGFSVDKEVSNCLGEVIIESKIMIMICSYIKGILLPTPICSNPIHHVLYTVRYIQHSPEHIIHVVSVCSPVDISLLVHEEETIIVLGKEVNSGLYMFSHCGELGYFISRIMITKFIRSGGSHTGDISVGVSLDRSRGAESGRIGGINSAIWRI
mmetsp:Transcript_3772/g.5778  ORF Transcript_3772/g.5778 Transcript_3772/m.5778 type:complete len:218 (-) Transcript_3772:151-804(-)